MNLKSYFETKKRIKIVKKINQYIQKSSLSGFLVTGSLAWGKNKAVTKKSDIDFYVIAPSFTIFRKSLKEFPLIPYETKKNLRDMLSRNLSSIDTISVKTKIGPFFGSVYFFTEKILLDLVKKLNNSESEFFRNLRPHNYPQTKEYKGLIGNKITFTTPLSKNKKNNSLRIRTDPVCLIEKKKFYGSIFLSHILFGDIYTDKNNTLYVSKRKARKFLKSILSNSEKKALQQFKRYLPRIERMSENTINKLFKTIWKS